MTETAQRFETVHGPHVYGVSRYAMPREYERRKFFFVYVLFEAFLLAGFVVFVVLSLNSLILPGTPVLVAIGFLGVILALSRPIFKHLIQFVTQLFAQELTYQKIYRVRNAAEEAVMKELCANLDSRWTIYRNVTLPASDHDKLGRDIEIDLVLVGPAGIYAIEIKHEDTALPLGKRAGYAPPARHWKPGRPDFFSQPASDAHHLTAYLRSNDVGEHDVMPILILTQAQLNRNFDPERRDIWRFDDLAPHIKALNAKLYSGKRPTDVDEEDHSRLMSKLQMLATHDAPKRIRS